MPAGDMSWVTSPGTFALASAVVFVSAVLYGILRGKLVPAATVERREQDWAERLAESKEREQLWRVAHGESEANVKALSVLVEKLTVQGETTVALLRALPRRDPPT